MKARCEDLLAQLQERAIKQLTLAFDMLTKQGQGYRFHDVEDGKPIDYDDCIGGYGIVLRKGTLPYYGCTEELLYHSIDGWKSLKYHDNISILATAADELLNKAKGE